MEHWYKDGLKFKCTGCGHCCTASPGYVFVDEQEVADMARHVGLAVNEFKRKYIRIAFGKMSLTESRVNYDCVFLKEKKCSIYEARPKQCRQFPWWPQNLKSEKAWQEAAKECEGINHVDAPIVSADLIEGACKG